MLSKKYECAVSSPTGWEDGETKGQIRVDRLPPKAPSPRHSKGLVPGLLAFACLGRFAFFALIVTEVLTHTVHYIPLVQAMKPEGLTVKGIQWYAWDKGRNQFIECASQLSGSN